MIKLEDTTDILKKRLQALAETRRKRKEVQAVRFNHWRKEEQLAYLSYLKENMPMIVSKKYRRENRIFRQISLRLGTRTPIQAKGHHQKLLEGHRTIQKVIDYLQDTYGDKKDERKEDGVKCEENVKIQEEDVSIKIYFQVKEETDSA